MTTERIPNSAKPRDLMRALEAAGFSPLRNMGDHHLYRHPVGVRVAVMDTHRPSSGAAWRSTVARVRRALRQVQEAA